MTCGSRPTCLDEIGAPHWRARRGLPAIHPHPPPLRRSRRARRPPVSAPPPPPTDTPTGRAAPAPRSWLYSPVFIRSGVSPATAGPPRRRWWTAAEGHRRASRFRDEPGQVGAPPGALPRRGFFVARHQAVRADGGRRVGSAAQPHHWRRPARGAEPSGTRRKGRHRGPTDPASVLSGGTGEAGKWGGAFVSVSQPPPPQETRPCHTGGSFRRPRRGACGTLPVGGPETPTSLCSPGHPYMGGWVGPRRLSARRVWLATTLASGTRPYLLSAVGGAARRLGRCPCTANELPLDAVLVTRTAASSFVHRPPPPASFRLLPPLTPPPYIEDLPAFIPPPTWCGSHRMGSAARRRASPPAGVILLP